MIPLTDFQKGYMTKKEQATWNVIKDWLKRVDNDEQPWEAVPAADLLTLMHEAEQDKKKQHSPQNVETGYCPVCGGKKFNEYMECVNCGV